MTPLVLFSLFGFLLVSAVALLILPPLWKPRETGVLEDAQAENLAIFRDQQAELAREKAEGTLSEIDSEQAVRELQHRLLEEIPETPARRANGAASRRLAVALLIALPLFALGGYALLGTPLALDPAHTAPRPSMTAADVEAMVARLAERLKANPDDPQGWIMLARSYKIMGRNAEAAEAYAKAEKAVAEDPDLLADYAEALAMGGTTGMRGKPRQLARQALQLAPEHPRALLLAGAAAMEAGERAEALQHWEKLLPMTEPGSEIEAMLKNALEKLRSGVKGAR